MARKPALSNEPPVSSPASAPADPPTSTTVPPPTPAPTTQPTPPPAVEDRIPEKLAFAIASAYLSNGRFYLSGAGGPALQDVCGITNVNTWYGSTERLADALTHLLLTPAPQVTLTPLAHQLALRLLHDTPSWANDPGAMAVLLCRTAALHLWFSAHPRTLLK